MLASIYFLISFQVGIDAGPVRVSCDQSVTTLVAHPLNPPENYEIQWEIANQPGVFLIVSPDRTTFYRVFMTDLDTQQVYEDWTKVLVHPGSADLNGDGFYDRADTDLWLSAWPTGLSIENTDANRDGRTNVLDWFYLCNFDEDPPNTPPNLILSQNQITVLPDEEVVVLYEVEDAEQTALVRLHDQASRGSAFILDDAIHYRSDPGEVGHDRFTVVATDGRLTTPPVAVEVEIVREDTFADIKRDLFDNHCENCHIAASEGGLNLGTYESARAGGINPPGFVPGSPFLSPIYTRVLSDEMPRQAKPLSFAAKERLRLWILRGALQ